MKNELQVIDFTNDISLFDEQFSLSSFQNSLKVAEQKSDSILDVFKNAVAKAKSSTAPEERYVVDMNADIKKALDNGDMKLVQNVDGELFAQVRNANGKFGKRLPIKKELAKEGVTAMDLQMALQLQQIKDQLNDIIDSLQEIEGKVVGVIQGQINDRVGLFYSGLSLYLEAGTIKDPYLRKQIISQAIKAISDANAQMIQEIRTSLGYLVGEKYRGTKKPIEHIEEKLNNIQQCYDVVFRASFLKAMIYQNCGELESMVMAIDEYSRFVEKMIVPFKGKLSELDKNSKFIDAGAWGTIAKTLERCSDLKDQLENNSDFILDTGGVEYGY